LNEITRTPKHQLPNAEQEISHQSGAAFLNYSEILMMEAVYSTRTYNVQWDSTSAVHRIQERI
jgi:hypothetical protein